MNKVLTHFKILVVFAFTLHIYWHLCKATNLYRSFTIIFYWSKATFMVYLKKLYIYIYIYISIINIDIIYTNNIYWIVNLLNPWTLFLPTLLMQCFTHNILTWEKYKKTSCIKKTSNKLLNNKIYTGCKLV